MVGYVCPDTEWCDYQPSICGAADEPGVCQPRPEGCTDEYQPVCACDGTVYGNPCDAQAAGFDVNHMDGCTAPGGKFACGAFFCQLSGFYCQRQVSDVSDTDDDFACLALPGGCGNAPSCACLAAQPCGDQCQGTAQTGLTVTCPGG